MPQYKVKPQRRHFQTRNPRTSREIFASKPDASTPHCPTAAFAYFRRNLQPGKKSRFETTPGQRRQIRAVTCTLERFDNHSDIGCRFDFDKASRPNEETRKVNDGIPEWMTEAFCSTPARSRLDDAPGVAMPALARPCTCGPVRSRARTLDSSRNVAVEGYVKTRPLTMGICDQAKRTTVFNAAFLYVPRTQHLEKNRTESKLGPINLRRPQAKQLSTSARYIVFHCGAHAYPLRFPPWRAHVRTLQIRFGKGSVSTL